MRKCHAITIAILCLALGGCTLTRDNIIAAIQAVVPVAIDSALVREAQNSPATANAVATTISEVCKVDGIPLVRDGQLSAGILAGQLQRLLESKVGPGWGTTIAGILGTIFGNVNIKAPAMSDNERAYVLAGLTAMASGCDQFLAGRIAMLDGSTMDRAELMACLSQKSTAQVRATDASPIPAPTFSVPQTYRVETNGCRSGHCPLPSRFDPIRETTWQSNRTHWEEDEHGSFHEVRD